MHVNQIDQLLAAPLSINLEGTLFVKPANMGSSIGITKVSERENLHSALQTAAKYDEWIVIEEAITGREIEISILGNTKPKVSIPGEVIPGADFYDFNDK